MSGKREMKKALHEQQLLDAAFSLFLEHGVERATVEQITRRAGVAKGTFYLYFREKQDIVGRIIHFWAESLLIEAQDMPRRDGGAFLEQVAGFMVDALICDARLVRFVYQNLTLEMFAQIAENPANSRASGMLDAMAALLEQGGVKIRKPRIAVFMILELIAGVCYQSVMTGDTLPASSLRPYLVNAVRGMVGSL